VVDRLEGPQIHSLKELRPGSAGDTSVEELYADYLKEREAEEGQL
jgi:hypothetical protein